MLIKVYMDCYRCKLIHEGLRVYILAKCDTRKIQFNHGNKQCLKHLGTLWPGDQILTQVTEEFVQESNKFS